MSVTTTTPSPGIDRIGGRADFGLLGAAVVVILDRDRAHARPACPRHVRPPRDIPAPARHAPRSRYRSRACHLSSRPAAPSPPCVPVPGDVLTPASRPLQAHCPVISAMATDRCCPPVQPKPMARCALPSSRWAGSRNRIRSLQPLEEFGKARVGARHSASTAGSRPSRSRKAGSQCGIAQEPAVKDHVHPARHAALVAEGLHATPPAAPAAPASNQRADFGLQVVRRHVGGVDQVVGAHADRGQQVDLALDPLRRASRRGPAGGGGGFRNSGGSVRPARSPDTAPRASTRGSRVSRSISSIRAVALKSRLRTSRPSAIGRPSGGPSISRGTSDRGRLSITS